VKSWREAELSPQSIVLRRIAEPFNNIAMENNTLEGTKKRRYSLQRLQK